MNDLGGWAGKSIEHGGTKGAFEDWEEVGRDMRRMKISSVN